MLCPPGLVCIGKVATDDPEPNTNINNQTLDDYKNNLYYINNSMIPLKCIVGHYCEEGTNTTKIG